ncbi:type II CRISPR-associated endonuclease Cas1 [Corynebacterium resistens]
MSWRILDLEDFTGVLSYQRGRIKICSETDGEVTLPLNDVAVVLCGHKCSISTGLMAKFGELGISLLVTDWRRVPICALQSWSNHTRVGARQLAQAKLSVPRAKHAWQQVTKSKIRGQAQVQLALGHAKQSRQLSELARQVRSGDPQNLEGQAAKLHWQHFVRDVPFTRNADSADPLNAMLNYGYTILRGFAIRSVLAAGLWPGLGIFHHGRSNAFNLADDLIEPFRPVVDHAVASLPPEASVTSREVKRRLASLPDQAFDSEGASTSTVMTNLARNFGRFVEGDIPRLQVPYWHGQS